MGWRVYTPKPMRDQRRNALVVGTNVATCRACRRALETCGFAVREMDSGVAAVRAARDRIPDIIFLDPQLRDVPGGEAIAWLRSNPALQTTPIVVMTAMGSDPAVPANTGVFALATPISSKALRSTVAAALAGSAGKTC